MKRTPVLILLSFFGQLSFAQNTLPVIPKALRDLPFKRPVYFSTDFPMDLGLSLDHRPEPRNTKWTSECLIGVTRFDLQTNLSVQNRVVRHINGTIGTTFNYGELNPGFPDRGTGYNFYNGTSWDIEPNSRIEQDSCGWPSYISLPGYGEMVITHNGTTGLIISSRTPAGFGSWTHSTLTGPLNSGGTTALLWPRAISYGNTIHLIACTDQGPPDQPYSYQGLAPALVYYKSTDGGLNWSSPVILSGMDSASIVNLPNKPGISGDSYSWARPAGDTIAFVCGDNWGGLFIMKSLDAGANWQKIPVYDFPQSITAPTPIIPTIDGSVACAIDEFGKVHVLTGLMRVSDDSFTDSIHEYSYYPYTDGVIYWNENMPPLDSALLNDPTALLANGQYLGYMFDYNSNDTIDFPVVDSTKLPFGTYYLSLSSMPQIVINSDCFTITYSSCREDRDNGTSDAQLYRHIYAAASANGNTWTDPIDLNHNIVHDYDECTFPSIASHPTVEWDIGMVYMADGEPGLAMRGDMDAYGDNYIYYLESYFFDHPCAPIGIDGSHTSHAVVIFPNPASDFTDITLDLTIEQRIAIKVYNILGQTVLSKDYGVMSGNQTIRMNTSNLTSGIYLVSIQAGADKVTRKLIVE